MHVYGGTYSQNGRRALIVQGTPDQPILIRAAAGESPLLTRPGGHQARQNNIEFVDCAHVIIRGLRFQGGSSGVRFIRGHHVDHSQIFDGGEPAVAFVDPVGKQFWPQPGSVLLSHGDAALAPEFDFNGARRTPPFGVGAYETDGQARNPGWTIQPGFKRMGPP